MKLCRLCVVAKEGVDGEKSTELRLRFKGELFIYKLLFNLCRQGNSYNVCLNFNDNSRTNIIMNLNLKYMFINYFVNPHIIFINISIANYA